ncbi:MAG: prepilin-type N-terminal cleavage/methylation domain-containing protein [Phycisphaerales bacterium]
MGHSNVQRGGTRGRRAFTVMELLVSIGIIAVLLGIAAFGVHAMHSAAKGAVGLTTVNQIGTGIEKFEESVGFPPPLVKDRLNTGAARAISQLTHQPSGTRNAILVYEPDLAPDIADLNTLNTVGNINTNPFQGEFRYSECSLAFYLVGALDVEFVTGSAVMMDGVQGPGLYKPTYEGEFQVPTELVRSNGAKRSGTPMESFVNLNGGDAKLAYPQQGEPRSVKLVDGKNVPFRYYRWINGDPANGMKVTQLQDLRIPRIVGRFSVDASNAVPDQTSFPTPPDRDIRQNPALRNAKWAVVAAGPNGVFGDEPLAQIAQALGKPNDPGEEAKLRGEAEKDNIVRVDDGQ